jgi:hypothetical protein
MFSVHLTKTIMKKESRVKFRGFASQTPERRKELAAMGGRAVQAKGKAYIFTTEASLKAIAIKKEKRRIARAGR